MLNSESLVLLGLVDLAIILGAIAMLIYVPWVRVRSSELPSQGRGMILWGISIAAIVFLTQVVASLLYPDRYAMGDPTILPSPIPAWLHWLLSRSALVLLSVGALFAILQRRRIDEAILASAQQVQVAEHQANELETEFRKMIETTSNSVYCYAFDPPMQVTLPTDVQVQRSLDAVLTECNLIFSNDLRGESPQGVIGTPVALLDSIRDEEAYSQFFTAFVDAEYRLIDYEYVYESRDGADRALSVNVTGIVQNGLLYRVWGVARNILDIRRTKTALYRRRLFQKMLVGISSRLVVTPFEESDNAIVKSLEEICDFIGADRFRLIWVNWEESIAEVAYSWRGEGVKEVGPLPFDKFPYFAKCLSDAEPVRIENIDSLPEEAAEDAQFLRTFGVKSFFFLPLKVLGDVVGAVVMTKHVEFRRWSDQDLEDLGVISNMIASYILRLRSRRALDEALFGLQKATDRLEAENVYLRQEIQLNHDFEEIIGESDVLRRCLQMVEQVADTLTPVLVLGETGTGKELVARALHEHSRRRDRPLVKVNCAALPANLIESELFGYEKGAFTGAEKSKRGRFDLAHSSSIFLDEIGEIPIELQAKLLRVLQDGEFERLGGTETIKVDVRIIAATNRDLWNAVENGEFRSDLLYRISTFPIELPALRDRGDDVRMLAEYFVDLNSQRLGRDVAAISANMMRQLRDYAWPGNVRELDGVIQRALISSSGPVLELGRSLAVRTSAGSENIPSVIDDSGLELRSVERDHIVAVLDEVGWKIAGESGAASRLGIPPSTLRSKMKRLAIERPH